VKTRGKKKRTSFIKSSELGLCAFFKVDEAEERVGSGKSRQSVRPCLLGG